MWKTSLEQDWVGVVACGVGNIQVTWRRGCQVAAQITEDNQSVAKETQSIADQVENALVLLSLLRVVVVVC